jgi:hypothetical protein
LGVGLARLVAKVVPLRRREGELRLPDVLGREAILEVVPLVDVGAADMLDFARTDDRFARLVAGLSWDGGVSSRPGL